MEKDKKNRVPSLLVCFAGQNQRINLNPKNIVKSEGTLSYKCKQQYTAHNGKKYIVNIESISNGKVIPLKANVRVTNLSGKIEVAVRNNVTVRWAKSIFE